MLRVSRILPEPTDCRAREMRNEMQSMLSCGLFLLQESYGLSVPGSVLSDPWAREQAEAHGYLAVLENTDCIYREI